MWSWGDFPVDMQDTKIRRDAAGRDCGGGGWGGGGGAGRRGEQVMAEGYIDQRQALVVPAIILRHLS